MRQIRKQILTIPGSWRGFCGRLRGVRAVVVAVSLALSGAVAGAGVVTAVVTDPLTGVAIDGYDPVSYFTADAPHAGLPEYEYRWRGVPWYFESAANRDVFRRAPEIYAPQFGGYGLMALARGYLSQGNPRVYAVLEDRLFLFYSTSNRDAFLKAQRSSYEKAAANWTELSQQLSGPEDSE